MRARNKISLAIILSIFLVSLSLLAVRFFSALPSSYLRATDHAVYIWQRLWTPELVSSLNQITSSITQVRVLSAELSAQGQWAQTQVDFAALNATGLPVYAVVRIDGRNSQLLNSESQADILKYIAHWQAQAPRLKGLEIDYDCPSSQLPVYTQFLRELRINLAPSLSLSNTLLPSWLKSPELPALLVQSDESVLQVHAVSHPSQGLFDATQALAWVKELQQLKPKSFRVALPAYGSRVLFGADGKILSINSERRQWESFDHSLELDADPQVVSDFIKSLDRIGENKLIWFRLPSARDERSWPLTSLLAVIHRQPLVAKIESSLIVEEANPAASNAQDFTRLLHLQLANTGNIAAAFPRRIQVLSGACTAADGFGIYRTTPAQNSWIFTRQQAAKLPPQQRQLIAWLRCPAEINKDELQIVIAQP